MFAEGIPERWARSVVLALMLSAPGGVAARDAWLEPGVALPTKGEELVVHLETGERLQGAEERALQKERVARFDLYGDRSARRDLLATAQDGALPAAKSRMDSGAGLVVMDRKPRLAVMEADKFNQYLADEGFDSITAQRAKLGQSDVPAREIYTRYLKALLQDRNPATATANTLYKRRVGQRLEILLENDPGSLAPDGKLVAKVDFDDHPLAGVRVIACRRAPDSQSAVMLQATTSAKGLVEFKLDQPDLWMLRCVYLRPMAPNPKVNAQWESFWSTYTFAARNAPAVSPIPRPSVSPRGSVTPAATPAHPSPSTAPARSGT